jgi:hypothetical protein
MLQRRFAILAAFISALAASAALAQADPGITADVQPVPAQVTLNRAPGADSLALDSYASFFVPLLNGGGSTLNLVFFNATVTSDGGAVTIESVIGLPPTACSGIGSASIACSIGSLAKGTGVNFYAVVRAPSSGTYIRLSYTTGGDEGNGGGNGCCNLSSTAEAALVDPATFTDFLKRTTSFVKPGGGVFFTGGGTAATTADPWVTLVTFPALPSLNTVAIVEERRASSIAPNLLTGETTRLTIPFPIVTSTAILRRDASTIAPGAKIASARIYYSEPTVPYPGINYDGLGYELQSCATGLTPDNKPLPQKGVPCIESRREYTKKLVRDLGLSADWELDWEFVLKIADNGRYSQ